MGLKQEIEQMVDSIRDGEWWKDSSRETFILTAHELIKEWGIPIKEVEHVLTSLYTATAAEYGD